MKTKELVEARGFFLLEPNHLYLSAY